MVVHTFNPNIQEAEAGGSLSLRPAWSTEQVLGQTPKPHKETLFQKKKFYGNEYLKVCITRYIKICWHNLKYPSSAR